MRTRSSRRRRPLRPERCGTRRRSLLVEGLEARLVLSALDINPQVWYPGGPSDGIDTFPTGGGSGNYSFSDGNRWSRTATQGGNLKQGDPTVLTWSIVPDGTPIPGYAREAAAPSNFRAWMQSLYGGSASGPAKDQPWFSLFVSMFNKWSDKTGVTYVYEAADDGKELGSRFPGDLGVRGDVRIGGHRIDGNSGILAYNFFPNVGDMVFDTADSFFNNKGSNSLRLRNVAAHEHGHGLGIAHVCPINQTKLMEPFYSGAFDGPQHDDILAGNRGYGDPYEKPRSNDAINKATNLGTLGDGTRDILDASIDDATDIDVYRFTVDAPKKIAITVSPVGSTYKSGPQNSNGSCSAGTDFNSKAQSDLSFEVLAFDGTTVLASVNNTGRGADETLAELRLPAKGDYYLRVKGLDKKAQLYNTAITVSANTAAVRGLVHFQAPIYDFGQQVGIEVRDTDLIGSNSITVKLTSPAGDEETVTLNDAGGGLFRGTIELANASSVQKNNNKIEANAGETLTVTYNDANTGSGSAGTATATTTVFKEVCEGPDAAGYVACTAMPTFEDISGTGKKILVNEDDTTAELTDSDLGTFTFDFYGTTYPNVYVNSNGLLTFGGSPGGAPTNSDLTSSPTPATLAVYWDDLYTMGIGDQVYWEVKGSGASERLIVQWNDMRYAVGDGDGVFFQAVLYKQTGVIEYNYLDLRGNTAADDGKSATVGIKASGNQGTRRLLLAKDNGPNTYVETGKTIRIARKGLLTVNVVADSVAENAGAGATQVTITRSNAGTSSALTVNLSSSDTTEATVPATATIPAGQNSVTVDLTAVDDTLLDGNQTVTITATATDFLPGSDTVTVTDYETLTVVISADAVAENAGAGATTATVTRSNTDNGAALTVNLASNDTTEATVPSSVTIPAGKASVSFNIDAVDDTLLDGTQTVTITGSASGYQPIADTVDVTDYETLTVVIAADAIAENAGAAATTATVTRSNTDNGAALTVSLTSNDTTEATVPSSVTIPAGKASVSFNIDAVDDTLLDGTQTVTITATASGYQAIADTVDVTDFETLTVAITADAIAENAGGAATTATVTRSNTDNSAALTVNLSSNDTSEATVPATVTIPAGKASVSFTIDAVDDTLLDGTQTVTITGTASGYQPVTDTVDVTDYETLTIAITADTIAENAGAAATTATVTRSNTDNAATLTVNLASNDTSEATVPATVTIPAGKASVSFAIDAVDDTLLDGTQTVTITGTASGYQPIADTVDVTDYETLTVAITADAIAENDGAAATAATVTRSNTDNSAALTVNLASNDTTEATVPATVTIPAGKASVSFNIDAVDDTLLDGTQTVTITGTASGYQPITDTVDVTDYETLTIAITADAIAENAGAAATTATVTRSNTDNSAALTVNLASNDTSEATVPATVTIPAGKASVSFAIDAVDDTLLDGTQTATITGTASGYQPIADTVDVTDYETLTIAITADAIAENAGAAATTATVTRSNTDNSAALTVNLASNDTSEATVPSTVTIPGGKASVSFNLDAVDDTLLDGTQTVTITGTASGYQPITDTVDVTDYETLTIAITADAIAENAGAAATTATVTRSNTDNSAALTVNLASNDTSEAKVPATVTIPAGKASVSFNIDAVDDTLLDRTQTVTISGTASGYQAITDTVDVTDYETLTVTLNKTSFFENEGSGAAQATITRSNTDRSAALVVAFTSSDTTEATVPASATIPAGAASVTVAVDAVDDTETDGTQRVDLTATASGYVAIVGTVDVLDNEQIAVTVSPQSFAENAGNGAAVGTVARNVADLSQPLTVRLSSSDTSEMNVPASVTIPAGKKSVTFSVDAVDDTLLDGDQSVTIQAATDSLGTNSTQVTVTDYETLTVTIAASSIAENAGAGAATATVTRSNTDNGAALTVTLTSSDTSEATVPSSITIPANQASVSFAIDAVDDALLDGTQTVTITASASGYVSAPDTLDVTDYETVTVVIAADSIAENAGAAATTATVTRSNTDNSASLTVNLTSSDTTEATVPSSVTIPAGKASVSFAIDAVDDTLLDGTQTVTITPTASGYEPVADTVDVTDYETLTIAITADAIAENAGAAATTATVTRSNTDNSAALTVSLASSDTTEATVPSTITIPAGKTSASFFIDAVDDTLLDGTQSVTITGTAAGYQPVADQVDVTDFETLTVVIDVDSISENAGADAATATVTRSNTDNGSALTVQLTSSDTTEATVPSSVTIPAGKASVSFSIDAVDDNLLDGTQIVTVTPAASGYVAVDDTLDVTDYETLVVAIAAESIAENAGVGATTATVTRSNTDNSSALTVSLTSSDTTEATVPSTVTIPAGKASVSFAVDAVDDTLLDGTQTVTLTARTGGYQSVADTVDVTDYETVTVVIATDAISENAGAGATTATVTRSNTDNSAALTVNLTSSDTTEATVPASVTIPAGKASVSFSIDAVDDNLLDGTQTVTITPAASGYVSFGDTVDVTDHETLTVVIAADSIAEDAGAGATTATLTRSNTDNSAALTVSLTSSDTSEASVPSTVTIPAGKASVSFSIDAVDDNLLDGTQTVTITPAASGYVPVADSVDVTDYETLTVVIAADAIAENDGPGATTATVTRSNTDNDSALTVLLASDDTSEATVPSSVTIPAGKASVSFSIDAVDDNLLDGTQTVTITPTAGGYVSMVDTVDVTDHETLQVSLAPAEIAENAGTGAATATISRSNTDRSTALRVALVSSDTTELRVPATAVIPAGKASVDVLVDAVDDTILDGTQRVEVRAFAEKYVSLAGQVDVTDYETLSLTFSPTSFPEDAGAAAATGTVKRNNTDISEALTVSLKSLDESEAKVPETVTIPAGKTSVSFAVDAVDDALLDGTQNVVIEATHPAYVRGTGTVSVTDVERLVLTIDNPSFSEDAGAGAATGTIERSNTDTQAALVVALVNSDTSELTVPKFVTIPAGSRTTTFAIDAVDDTLLDGTQTVTLQAYAERYQPGTATVDVADHEFFTVTIDPATIREDAGSGAATGTVRRSNTDTGSALTVTLTSDDTSETSVPTTVTIPANQSEVSFAIGAVDDDLLDGSQTATITAAATGYFDGSASLTVADYETLTVTVDRSTIREDAGRAAATATVRRSNSDTSSALTVSLASSDTTEATVPSSVTIPAGANSVTFPVDAVDDSLLDGTQSVTLTAQASGYASIAGAIDVDDAEFITLEWEATSVTENAGVGAIAAIVTRSNTDIASALVVNLASDDTSELTVPATVTIPAGASSVRFTADAVDDTLLDGTQTVSVSVAATGYIGESQPVDVLDHEFLTLTLDKTTVPENAGAGATQATVRRSNTDVDAALVVQVASGDTSEAVAPAQVTIPAGSSEVSLAIDAVDDRLLDGDQSVTFTVSAGGYVDGTADLTVTDYETLTVTLGASQIRENDGAGATTVTVRRSNEDTTEALVVQLASSDTSEATLPATVTIPAGAASATTQVDAVDDRLLDESQDVIVTASAEGYVAGSDRLTVNDYETLTLEVAPAIFSEGAGTGAAVGTVTRSNTDRDTPITVFLESLDTTETQVPQSVVVPAGAESATFLIDAVDDSLVDGTQLVELVASSTGYENGTQQIQVTDAESLSVIFESDAVREDAGTGAVQARIIRNTSSTDSPLVVQLDSSDTTELVAPPSVTIPADTTSVLVALDVIDDTLLDGTQVVTLRATADGFLPGEDTLEVRDHEVLTLDLSSDTFAENAGAAAATAVVTRGNTDTAAELTVRVSSSDLSEATTPTTVVIPAGQSSVSFPVDAIDDRLLDGPQNVTLTVAADGYFGDTADLTVTDAESLEVRIDRASIRESDGTSAAQVTITRSDVDDLGAEITVRLSSSDTSEVSLPAQAVIPAGTASTTIPLDAVDDTLLDGTQQATVVADADGFIRGEASIDILDHEFLTLVLSTDTVAENAGAGAVTAQVRRSNTDVDEPLVVTLGNSDDSEVQIPTSVTIPAGANEVAFPVDIVDDTLLDGTQVATLTAGASGYDDGMATLEVTDYEWITATLSTSQIAEDAGNAAVVLTIQFSNTDRQADQTIELTSSDTTEAVLPSSVVIPAGSASVDVPVDIVDDTLLDGTQQVELLATADGYQGGSTTLDVLDAETLTIEIDREFVSEDDGTGAAMATIRRSNTDVGTSLTVQLQSSDSSELAVPSTVTFASGEATVQVPLDAIDDDLLDGTQTVEITVSAAGYRSGSGNIDVRDHETLTVTILPDRIREDGGAGAAVIRLERSNTDRDVPLTVQLASDDPSELQAPSQIVIPAGQASVQVAVDAVDDALLDGTQTATVTASADGYVPGADSVDVDDAERILLQLDRTEVGENAGAGAIRLTVARENTDVDSSLTVQLASSDTTEGTLPAEVTIPAGQASIDVSVDIVDDTLLDGTQPVSFSASATGYLETTPVVLMVLDHETLTVSVSPSELDEEPEGVGQTEITVRRNNTDIDTDLAVTLQTDATELTLPDQVVIPAGEDSVVVSATVVRDYIIDGDQNVAVTAVAAGYVDGQTSVTVRDDPFPWYNDRNPFDVNDDGFVTPLDALLVIDYLTTGDSNDPNPPTPPPPFYDTNNSGDISPIDVLGVVDYLQNVGEAEGTSLRSETFGNGDLVQHPSSPEADDEAWIGVACPAPPAAPSAIEAFHLQQILDDIAEDVAREWKSRVKP